MSLCHCGAEIINGHHCENGHLQDRSGQRGTLEDVIDLTREKYRDAAQGYRDLAEARGDEHSRLAP